MAFKWTEAEFIEVKRLYAQGQSLEDIQALNPTKSVASIRMKLVKAGVYEKPLNATKLEGTAAFKQAHAAVGDAFL